MKKIFISAFVALVFCSCVGNKAELVVSIEPLKEGRFELRYITPNQNGSDVVNTLYKGTFSKGKIEIVIDSLQYNDGRKDCMLFISGNDGSGYSLPVVLEKGKRLNVKIEKKETNIQISYSGTSQSKDFNEFWQNLSNESQKMQQRNANLDAHYANLVKIFRKYIDEYPDAEVPYMLLAMLVQNMQKETANPLLAYCNELCIESKTQNQWRNTFCDVLKSMQLANITATKLVFTGSDRSGKVYSERDIKGKIILVDFWASWCKPCKEEIPHLKQLYTQYRAKGLEIVSLSMDKNSNEWQSYIDRNPMPWLSLLGDGQTLSERYSIEYIPFNLICDEEGNVLQKNLHGEDLENAIKTLLEK
jgi:thiol-disulfide isomerase/thioredoxin